MTGMMVATVGGTKRVNYAAGLYGPSGVDLSPISAIDSNNNTPTTRTWIGYYRAPSTGTFTIGIQAVWTSDDPFNNQYSRGYVWVGNTALSGYNTGNALAVGDNSTGTGNIGLVVGVYYPIRIQWDSYLPFDSSFFGGYDTSGSMSFSVNSSTAVSGAIFYNTATNGF
jgi:hypothetical protein